MNDTKLPVHKGLSRKWLVLFSTLVLIFVLGVFAYTSGFWLVIAGAEEFQIFRTGEDRLSVESINSIMGQESDGTFSMRTDVVSGQRIVLTHRGGDGPLVVIPEQRQYYFSEGNEYIKLNNALVMPVGGTVLDAGTGIYNAHGEFIASCWDGWSQWNPFCSWLEGKTVHVQSDWDQQSDILNDAFTASGYSEAQFTREGESRYLIENTAE